MAGKKQTATQKLRAKIKRQIRAMEKRGYIVPESTKEKINNANYSRLKSYEKSRYKRLKNESELKPKPQTVDFSDLAGTFDPETGEIFEPSQFYENTGYNYGGTMETSETSDLIIGNVIDNLLDKLEQDVPEYYLDSSGHRRYMRQETRENIIRAKQSLKQLIYDEINSGNSEELARRIIEHADEIGELTDRLYSYDEMAIGTAQANLANIITGRAFSAEEMSNLDASMSMVYGYNEPR